MLQELNVKVLRKSQLKILKMLKKIVAYKLVARATKNADGEFIYSVKPKSNSDHP